jgi:hypothetical protein
VAVAVSGTLLLYLFAPGALEELLAGEMEGETLDDAMGFFLATVGIIPVVMAALTLLVTDRVNRHMNLIAGLVFGLFGVYAVVGHLSAGDFNVHVLMVAMAGALAFLIAGLGLVGLRQPSSQAAAGGTEQSRPREEATV